MAQSRVYNPFVAGGGGGGGGGEINTASNVGTSSPATIDHLVDATAFFNIVAANPLAQQITTPSSPLILETLAWRYRTNSNGSQTGTAYVEIRTDNGADEPSTTVLATSDSHDLGTETNPTTQVDVLSTFASPPTLAANTKYWLVLRYPTASNGTGSSFGLRGTSSSASYPDGITKYEGPVNTWNANLGDMYFQVSGQAITGIGVFKQKTLEDLEFKSIQAGSNVNVVETADNVQISANIPTPTNISIQTNVYTSSNTWTKPANLKFVRVTVVGGGGGSGGTRAALLGSRAYSGGGGGGGAAIENIAAASLGATVAVTIGAGGTAGASTPTNGGTGGTTSFGGFLSASGGGGSLASNSSSTTLNYSVGGSPGSGSGGNVNFIGKRGGNSYHEDFEGGDSILGYGAQPTAATDLGHAGVTGQLYGGGASGSLSVYVGAVDTNAGAAGGAGLVIVESYIEG